MKAFRNLFVRALILSFICTVGFATAQTVELWTFANTHARWYQEMAERYREEVNPDFQLNVSEVAFDALHERLLVSLQSGGIGAPDISDIEQGAFGSFLRGGGDPGLVDLRPRLEEGGYLEELVAAREALYTSGEAIYGIEHALTPVVLYYRSDLFEAAGVDPNELETWEDFVAASAEMLQDGQAALRVTPDLHQMLLLQRGGDYFDDKGNVTIDSPLSIETMEWLLAQIDAGVFAQAPATGREPADWAAYAAGDTVSQVHADWFAGSFKDSVPELSGKWKAAPLPAWEPGGARTSVLGGTGATIVATSPNIEEAWRFLEFAMLSVDGNVRRYELTNLFPPFKPAWDDERLYSPDPYFSGQTLGRLFAEVGAEAPAQHQSAYRSQLNDLRTAAFQDILDRNRTPEEAFTDIANSIREEMEFDQ